VEAASFEGEGRREMETGEVVISRRCERGGRSASGEFCGAGRRTVREIRTYAVR